MGLGIGVTPFGANQIGEYTNPNQILDGSVTATNTTSPQTIITVPANRTWIGTIVLSASATAATAGLYKATVNTSGANAIPANAINILTAHMSLVGASPAGLATFSDEIVDVIIVAPAGNAVTLTLTNSTATAMTSDANAVGILL